VCSNRASSPGRGCWQDGGFQALSRRWSACDLRKSPCHRSHDSCYRVITRPSWRAIPGQRLLPHLQESIRAGRPGGPVYPQEPRLLARAARSPTAGSARWVGASRRWCQSGAGPPVRRAARTQGCAVAQPCTPPDALVRHRRNQARRGAGLGREPDASSPARTLTRPDPRRQPRPSLFGVPALDAPMAAPTATDADLKRLDGAGRLTILLDPATPPASSHGVQRSGRSPEYPPKHGRSVPSPPRT
jgi:hypothetical protein